MKNRAYYEKSRLFGMEMKAVADTAFEDGRKKGLKVVQEEWQKGLEEGGQIKSVEVIKNLISYLPDLSDEKIAGIVVVPETLVAKIRKELNEKIF